MFAWKKGDLNDEQEAAIAEPGSVFLIACPGSGKTRTLTYKIARELSLLTSPRQWVVAITYTHRAADEIHERIEALGVDTSRLWIGTIHSFCLEWILKPYSVYHPNLRNGFRVISPHDRDAAIEYLCDQAGGLRVWDCEHHYTSAGRIQACQDNRRYAVADILDQYQHALEEDRALDFELILRYAYELIARNPTIPRLLSGLFPIVLVDEYQDTKEIQYEILAAIMRAGQGSVRAFIVGDPNQAIYGSLGGYAMAPEAFEALSGASFRRMELSRNYRSSDRIIRYYEHFSITAAEMSADGPDKDFESIISYDVNVQRDALEAELVRLIQYSIETAGISPSEVCVLAPQWAHLASMTRALVGALPQYTFNGPGIVPFARDIDNFWYRLSRIALTAASPEMYVRRHRWAGEILSALQNFGIDTSGYTRKSLLRECNAIVPDEADGLAYLRAFFDSLFAALGIDIAVYPALNELHLAFFESSAVRLARVQQEGRDFSDVASFKKVFENRDGITVSTIHGVKGTEFDVVIAYALLQGMVPHFSDADVNSANRLIYVTASRARKNLHLISEQGRRRGGRAGQFYTPTDILYAYGYTYGVVPPA